MAQHNHHAAVTDIAGGAMNGWDTGHPRDHGRTLALLLDAGARPDPTIVPTGHDGIDGILRDWFRKSAAA